MVFDKGDFLLVEYTVRIKDTNTVIETTDPELAKRENIYEPSRLYGPVLIILGKNWLNQYVEEEITKMNENEEREFEIPPEKAYGARDPGKIKTFSSREFQRRGYSVKVGDVVEIGGIRGVVKQISGGRITVDFNHPLAGKTLIYKIKVVKKLEDIVDKIKTLVSRHLRIPSGELNVEYVEDEKKVTIHIPGKYIALEHVSYAKLTLAADIFEFFKDKVTDVIYQEELRKP